MAQRLRCAFFQKKTESNGADMSVLFSSIVKGCFAWVLTLIFASPLAGAQLFSLSSIIGWWDYDDRYFREVDPATGATISFKWIRLPPGSYGAYTTGLAAHPTTGEFFALVASAPRPTPPMCQHLLARINPATGAATIIGNTGDCFASLAFHSNGTLYGVTNSEGAVPPSLFTLDTTSATPTFLISFDRVGVSDGAVVGGSGLAFNPNDGLLYRSGRVGYSDPIFQAIDPDTLAVTDIPLSGSPSDEIIALTHSFGNTLLGADVGNRLFSITTEGVRTLIGPMDHLARGLVFASIGFAVPFDFDGDGKSDIAVYRDGAWLIRRSFDGGITAVEWGGLPKDRPVPADYDGDGKVDYAVYRDGMWFILRSSDGGVTGIGWGGLAQDKPVPADYDGDGKTDIAVYRDGMWYIIRSSDGGVTVIGWGGLAQDKPVPADYDGDGKADIAAYRSGRWFIIRSSDGGQTAVGWGGLLADTPVPADYDGDGKADIAVYRNGTWLILRSSDGGQTTVGWGGLSQDVPVPGDFDGDGKVDVAVYRNGMWFILRSSDSGQIAVEWGGAVEDVPLY
jgi:hypothetical protein